MITAPPPPELDTLRRLPDVSDSSTCAQLSAPFVRRSASLPSSIDAFVMIRVRAIVISALTTADRRPMLIAVGPFPTASSAMWRRRKRYWPKRWTFTARARVANGPVQLLPCPQRRRRPPRFGLSATGGATSAKPGAKDNGRRLAPFFLAERGRAPPDSGSREQPTVTNPRHSPTRSHTCPHHPGPAPGPRVSPLSVPGGPKISFILRQMQEERELIWHTRSQPLGTSELHRSSAACIGLFLPTYHTTINIQGTS